MAGVSVKICGLRTKADVDATARAGAAYCGFVFFEKSPRNIDLATAMTLAAGAPQSLSKVALVVNATDAFLDDLTAQVPIDVLQLHGSEPPERVAEIKSRTGLQVMKAVGVARAIDLADLDAYSAVADQILVDAKPPKDANLPGGNGLTFDWRLIAGRTWDVPWMLAGGLTPENAAEAVGLTGATQLDVSSGVERVPGEKDAAKIAAFVAAVS